jgi:hypothetical protein
MTQPQTTTVQLTRELVERLRRKFPDATFDQAVTNLMAAAEFGDLKTDLLQYSQVTPILGRAQQDRRAPFNGHIVAVFFHFPPGPSNLVDVRVNLQRRASFEQIVPRQRDTYIALDDNKFPVESLLIPVEPQQAIQVQWFNHDGAFAHTIPVSIVVKR